MFSYVETYKFVVAIGIQLRPGKSLHPVSTPDKGQRHFSLVLTFQTECGGQTRLLFNWYQYLFSWRGQATGAIKLTTHLYILSRLRMNGDAPPLSHMPTWRAETNYLYVYYFLYHERYKE